jgi:uncharacterized membrane protein YqaE (UPF0057 family)
LATIGGDRKGADMIYVIAFLLPPLAVYMTNKDKLVLNIVLTLLLWLPGFIHAIMVINAAQKSGQPTGG